MNDDKKSQTHHERQTALLTQYLRSGYTPKNIRYNLDTHLNLDHDDSIAIHRIQKQAEMQILEVLIQHHIRASSSQVYQHLPPSLDTINETHIPHLGQDVTQHLPVINTAFPIPNNYHPLDSDTLPNKSHYLEKTVAKSSIDVEPHRKTVPNPIHIFKTYQHLLLPEPRNLKPRIPLHQNTSIPTAFISHNTSPLMTLPPLPDSPTLPAKRTKLSHEPTSRFTSNIPNRPPHTESISKPSPHTQTRNSSITKTKPDYLPEDTIQTLGVFPHSSPTGSISLITDPLDIIRDIRSSVSHKRKYPARNTKSSPQCDPLVQEHQHTLSPTSESPPTPPSHRTIYRHLRPRSQMSPHSPTSTKYPHQLTPSQNQKIQNDFAGLWDPNDSWEEPLFHHTIYTPKHCTDHQSSQTLTPIHTYQSNTHPKPNNPSYASPLSKNFHNLKDILSKNYQSKSNPPGG